MKKIILSFCLAGSLMNMAAQSGRITYKETIKFDIKLEGEQSEQFAGLLPKENTSEKMLTYTPQESLFETAAKEEEAPQEMSGGGVFVMYSQSNDKMFVDLKNQKRIEQRDFMGRMFLVESEMDTLKWKMTGNSRKILDYVCMEATTERDADKITVWFTPEIPVPSGPGELHGLPGLILGVDINNGNRVTMAIKAEPGDIAAKGIERPKKGKKVTRAEYEKIVAEKNKEMGIEAGKSGSTTVRMKIITQ